MRLVPLEKVETRTLLGIRFWDRLTNQIVMDGLKVKAQRLSGNLSQGISQQTVRRVGKAVWGKPMANGVIAFFGLSPYERSQDMNSDLLDSTAFPPQSVIVEVEDSQARFLPMAFTVEIPFKGIFRGIIGPNDLFKPPLKSSQALGVPLWSAPTRSVSSTFAVLRAQLVDRRKNPETNNEENMAAAHALVMVKHTESGNKYAGLADKNGMLMLPFPYPPIPETTGGSPPLDQQKYELKVSVRYQWKGDLKNHLFGELFDLETLLKQKSGAIVEGRDQDVTKKMSAKDRLEISLQFGQPKVLRTMINGNKQFDSVLHIQPK